MARRRNMKGTRKRGRYTQGGSASMSMVKAFLNPFSDFLNNPKIPDGAAVLSSGVRCQAVHPVTCAGEHTVIRIRPGLNEVLHVYQTWNATAPLDAVMTTAATKVNYSTQTAVEQVAQWRKVSLAARISLVNNQDENDGWFEAVRIPNANDPTIIMNSMVDDQSYITGKLRDIGKYQFQLKPTDGDFDFRVVADETATSIDNNFDSIIIVIHGRAPAEGIGPTRVLCHVAGCVEYVFNTNSLLRRYMTATPTNMPQLNKARALLRSSYKAGRKIAY